MLHEALVRNGQRDANMRAVYVCRQDANFRFGNTLRGVGGNGHFKGAEG